MSKANAQTVKRSRKKWLVILCMAIMLISMTGCSGQGTPPVLTVEGFDITLGQSTPSNWKDFTMTFAGGAIPVGKLDGNSWLTDFLVAKKDGSTYAYVHLYNPDREAKFYSSCIIYEVTFTMHSEEASYWAENNILVNGINFYGMNSDQVKEAMQDYKLANETDSGSLRYDDGSYKYFFRFNQTTKLVNEISVEMTIRKGY